jgi:hypothetical protein
MRSFLILIVVIERSGRPMASHSVDAIVPPFGRKPISKVKQLDTKFRVCFKG